MYATVVQALLGVPVAVKVMGIVLGVVILFSSGMLWSIHQTWHAALRRELDEHARALAADLARSCLVRDDGCDDAALRRRLAEARALDESVEYVLVQDSKGVVIAHTQQAQPLPELARANGLGPDGTAQLALVEVGEHRIHDAAAPIVGDPGRTLRVGISERRVWAEVAWLSRRLGVVTLSIAGLSLAGAWLLTRVLARPVHELVAATRSVREGRLDVAVPVRAKDEIGELATGFNAMAASLKEQARERQRLVRKAMGAAEAERKRLARELHDETGQALTSAIAGLSALETRSLPGSVGDQLAGIRALAEETLRDIQDVSRALRPSALDDFGLESALRRQCESMSERLGCSVELQTIGMDGKPRLSPEMEIALYRIVQESLTNAVRHGRARTVHVLLHRMESRVLVVVEDDGGGFDSSEWRAALRDGHLGLAGIEERAALFAGSVRVESAPGSGTSVFVELPFLGEA
jgi:signal transduction histidine kinase